MTPKERKAVYLEYLKMKIAEEDWHGVADCAMDLREIEVEISLQVACDHHKRLGVGPCPLCVKENENNAG